MTIDVTTEDFRREVLEADTRGGGGGLLRGLVRVLQGARPRVGGTLTGVGRQGHPVRPAGCRQGPALAKEYRVSAIPTVLLFDHAAHRECANEAQIAKVGVVCRGPHPLRLLPFVR
jgi:hypothetical protein